MNFSESLVPPGCSSVMAEISHSPHRDLTGRDLIAETIDGLQRVGRAAARRRDPRLEDRADLAGVRDLHARSRGCGRHDSRVAHGRRRSTRSGRFGEWAYFNMDDAIASGRDAVRSLQSGGEETIIDLVAAERGLPTAPWRTRKRSDRPPRRARPPARSNEIGRDPESSGGDERRLQLGGELAGPADGPPVHVLHEDVGELAVAPDAQQAIDADRGLEPLPIGFVVEVRTPGTRSWSGRRGTRGSRAGRSARCRSGRRCRARRARRRPSSSARRRSPRRCPR